MPIHRVSTDGTLLLSFGADRPSYRWDRHPSLYIRPIAASTEGLVWSALPFEYQLDLWEDDGTRLRSLTKSPDWFRPTRPPQIDSMQLQAIREAEGRLWVIIVVPDPAFDWAGYKRSLELTGQFPSPKPLPRERWDSIVEVLDARDGALIARTRHDSLIAGWVGDELYSYDESTLGDAYFQLYSSSLREH